MLPSFLSLLADIVATCNILLPETFFLVLLIYLTTLSTAELIPFFIFLTLSNSECSLACVNIACANIVAVVVPSPASLTVL